MRDLILIDDKDLPSSGVFGRDIAIKRYQELLGTTQTEVFWDATGGLHPNAFAAIAGTIKDNHYLNLYLPEDYPDGDPDHRQMMDYGRPIELAQPYFNQRLRTLITQPSPYVTSPVNSSADFKLTPQVILGKRGRGKSTLLAEKIRWLIEREPSAYILLVTTFAAHRERIIAVLTEHELCSVITLPPDEASRLLPSADYLIIDEAASLPAKQLITLTNHYPYFSLATSEDGYEGSGRFFSLQTLAHLRREHPLLEVITLHKGHRFSAQDPLEKHIEQIFFPQIATKVSDTSAQTIDIRAISQQTLVTNEHLLAQIYQLLFEGHYKTQPADMKRLLDLPDQYLFVAFKHSHPIAVLHILIEQPLNVDLATQVMHNTRRPQGRLLMQQLLLHTQQINYALKPIARIQRIVTQAAFRRQGLASQLIDYALKKLPYRFGVSYGATQSLETFWATQNFITLFRSPKINARNGRFNVIQLHKK